MGNRQALGLTALRILLGVFFLFMGIAKLGWFLDASILTKTLTEWQASAGPLNRWFLETVSIPAAEFFARIVPTAELLTGAALVLGAYARLTATLALLMVLSFAFASGVIFTYGYLTNGFGLPVVGGLLALAIGAVNLPFSLKR